MMGVITCPVGWLTVSELHLVFGNEFNVLASITKFDCLLFVFEL